jgi:hypothetical protein
MATMLRTMNPLLESGELKAPSLSNYTEVTLDKAADAYAALRNGSRAKYIIAST